jgi:hypothetical protein
MRASLPPRNFSASCRGQVRPTLIKSLRTRSTQTAHSMRRWNSSNTSSGSAFWTTSRALALATVVGAGAYIAASGRSTSPVTVTTASAKDPTYGDIIQFEKVPKLVLHFIHTKLTCTRQLPSFEQNLEKTLLAPTTTTFTNTATQNGQPSTPSDYQSPSHTPDPPKRSLKLPKSATNTECPWSPTPEALVSRPISLLLMAV